MSQLAPQGEYSPTQMQMLLRELTKHPELQTRIVHHVTQNDIRDPQAIATLMHDQLLKAQPPAQASDHPFANLVSGLNLLKYDMVDMGKPAQLPAAQTVAAAPMPEQDNYRG